MRRCLSDILNNADMSFQDEYGNLHELFYNHETYYYSGGTVYGTLYGHTRSMFLKLPSTLRKSFSSIDYFEKKLGLGFRYKSELESLDEFILFCELSYNFANCIRQITPIYSRKTSDFFTKFYTDQILEIMDRFGYISNIKNGITNFVPKNPAAIAVAEIIDEDLAYDVIEYNHHSMRGDLLAKKTTLLRFANLLEPKRSELKAINEKLSVNIFFMFNNLDLRHNNSTSGDKNYQLYTEQMSKADLEAWYDELYQMCLLAFLELDNVERAEKVDALKKNYKG